MPAFTVELNSGFRFEHREMESGLVPVLMPLRLMKHFAENLGASFRVMESGVLLITSPDGIEYLSPREWNAVYDGAPRL